MACTSNRRFLAETFDVCLRIIKQTDNIGIAPLAHRTRIKRVMDLSSFHSVHLVCAQTTGIMHLRDRAMTPSATAFVEQALAMEKAYFDPEKV